MQVAFLVDPLPILQPHHDTSVALMEALQQRGHSVFSLELSDLSFRDGSTWGRCDRLQLYPGKTPWYAICESLHLPLSQMDAVWMRKDPPVDAAYITATQLLDTIGGNTLVLNDPAGLRSANEKLFALHFPDWAPTTVVTQHKPTILDFVAEQGQAVLKPLDGKGGEGIFFLQQGDRNLNSLIEVSTHYGTTPVMVQEYLPAAAAGDKRILLLEGRPLGAVNRIPGRGDFRGNVAAGGSVDKVGITARERKLCEALAPVLQRQGFYFVGIDVIGERLTEINVTSPTMLRETGHLEGTDLAAEVAAWLEAKLA